ncbi:MAG: hypothetical protein ACJ72N_23265 [Labedaea sp.]
MAPDRKPRIAVLAGVVIVICYALVFLLLAVRPAAGPWVQTVAYALMAAGLVVVVIALVRRRSR